MLKKAIIALGLFFLLLPGAAPVHALDIYWRPAGDNTSTYSQRPHSTTNKVDLQVRVEDAKEVKINNEEAIRIGGGSSELWLLRDYFLKPGNNTISVKVEKYRFDHQDKKKKTETGNLQITVINDPLPNSERHFESIGKKIAAFNNAVSLSLPKDTTIYDDNKNIVWDQSVTIKSSEPGFSLFPDYIPVSPLYSIETRLSSYSLSNAGELTLGFDADAGIANHDLITVLYAPSLFQVPSLQPSMLQRTSSYKTTSDQITIPFSSTGFGHYIVVRITKDFKDFYLKKAGGLDLEWAYPYVLGLWARGIMDPLATYPDGTPVPEGYFGLTNKSGQNELSITRKEFICMLGKGFRLPLSLLSIHHSQTFSDMQNLNITEVQYIQAALKAGWLPNAPATDGKLYFRPNNPLTREQACIFIANATGLQLQTPEQATQAMKANFPNEYTSIYSWHRPHVMACLQSGFLAPTKQGNLGLNKNITRAEAAKMVYNILGKNK